MKILKFTLFSCLAFACLCGCSKDQKAADQTQQPVNAVAPPSGSQPLASNQPAENGPSSRNPVKKSDSVGLSDKLPPETRKEIEKTKKQNEQALIIPKNNTEDWVASSVSPQTIIGDIEKSLPQLRNTDVHITAVVKTPDGTGDFNQEAKIKDPDQYVVPFIAVGIQPMPAKIFSNGKLKMIRLGTKWQKPIPVSNSVTVPPAPGLLPAFERDFTQSTFEPITKTGESWGALGKKLADPEEGYHVTVESRALPFTLKGKQYFYRNFRIHAVRAADVAKKLGQSEIEIVVDGYHSFPETIRTVYTDPTGKGTWNIEWNCAYFAGKKFTNKDFDAPYTAKINPKTASS